MQRSIKFNVFYNAFKLLVVGVYVFTNKIISTNALRGRKRSNNCKTGVLMYNVHRSGLLLPRDAAVNFWSFYRVQGGKILFHIRLFWVRLFRASSYLSGKTKPPCRENKPRKRVYTKRRTNMYTGNNIYVSQYSTIVLGKWFIFTHTNS